MNLLLVGCALTAVWRRLRPGVPRSWWWASLVMAAVFPPLLSTVRWKQFNLIALALAVLAMQAVRNARPALGGSLLALSVCVKPLIILLPLGLLAHTTSRRAGLWSLGGIALFATVSQVFLASRSRELRDLSPLAPLTNFSDKAEEWVPHVGNLSPEGLLARGAGRGGCRGVGAVGAAPRRGAALPPRV